MTAGPHNPEPLTYRVDVLTAPRLYATAEQIERWERRKRSAALRGYPSDTPVLWRIIVESRDEPQARTLEMAASCERDDGVARDVLATALEYALGRHGTEHEPKLRGGIGRWLWERLGGEDGASLYLRVVCDADPSGPRREDYESPVTVNAADPTDAEVGAVLNAAPLGMSVAAATRAADASYAEQQKANAAAALSSIRPLRGPRDAHAYVNEPAAHVGGAVEAMSDDVIAASLRALADDPRAAHTMRGVLMEASYRIARFAAFVERSEAGAAPAEPALGIVCNAALVTAKELDRRARQVPARTGLPAASSVDNALETRRMALVAEARAIRLAVHTLTDGE